MSIRNHDRLLSGNQPERSRWSRLNMSSLGMIVILGVTSMSTALAESPVQLRLRDRVSVSHAVISVGDVARISGDDEFVLRRIRQLDLTVLDAAHAKETIRQDHLRIRLHLAGFERESVTITGPAAVKVTFQEEEYVSPIRASLEATSIESAARDAMAGILSVDREDISVQLAAPLDLKLDDSSRSHSTLRVDVLPPVRPQPGRIRMSVRLFEGDSLKRVVSGLFDVRVRQTVTLAAADLPRGTVITAEHLTTSDRWTDAPIRGAALKQVQGRSLRRPVSAGQAISTLDLTPPGNTAPQPVIKTRDIVRLTARRGTLTVIVPAAEALQSGVVGEMIRVRNLESRKTIVGRVVSAGEVEVRLD